MDIMKTDHITSIQVNGLEFRIETADDENIDVYLGDEHLVLTQIQFREFAVAIFNHK